MRHTLHQKFASDNIIELLKTMYMLMLKEENRKNYQNINNLKNRLD